MTVTTRRPLKTGRHHWWPLALSEHWEGSDGIVSAIRPNGTMTRSPDGNFGGITNAHHMKLGGLWDSSFEPIFNTADSEMSELVEWLLGLDTNTADPNGEITPRILAQPLPEQRQHQMARCVASLAARSPRTRNAIQLTTEYYRGRVGLENAKADKTLIALNQRGLYDAYCQSLEGFGRWAVLFSDATEFIFGDGFLHNFPATTYPMHGSKCVLPLTPTITIIYMRPMSHPTEPKLVTIRLDNRETAFFNRTVQIYSKDFLFFRSQKPELITAFTDAQFYEYKYHQTPWLEWLLDELAQYNLWGPGRTPSRTRRAVPAFDLDAFVEKRRSR